MTSIVRLQQILAQIRSTLASKADRPVRTDATASAASTRRTARPGIDALRAGISAGLAGADLATDGGRRMARRAFLESVLLAEFGEGLANDPRFAEVIDGVQGVFEQEAQLRADLDDMLLELRR